MSKLSLCFIALVLMISSSSAQTPGGWTTVPSSQYNDTNIQKFLWYGFDKVYLSAVTKGQLNPTYSVDNFTIDTIYSIQTQVVSGMNYKYNLTFTSNDGAVTIDANYIVYNQAWNNITRVSSLNYTIWNNNLPGGYQAVPESDYNNTDIQEFMDFGINNILSLAYNSGKINYSDDNISDFTAQIVGIWTQVVNGMNYKYQLILDSDDGAYTINTTFVVYNQAWTNRTNFVQWWYIVHDNKTPNNSGSVGSYTEVPPSNYNDTDIQEFMDFGIEDIVSQATQANKFSGNYTASDFTVEKINGIWEQIVAGINYKYDLILVSNDEKYTIDTQFVVFNQAWTNTTDMEESGYTIVANETN